MAYYSTHPISLIAFCVVSTGTFWLTRYIWKGLSGGPKAPLPPGPRLLPVVGSLFDIDVSEPWLAYTRWAKKYGDIVHFRVLGKDHIVINSETVARELLEKRSKSYSDRPSVATNHLFGLDFNTALLPYSDRWKSHRKIYHQTFRPESVVVYRAVQFQKAHILLLSLLESPDNFMMHLQTYGASIIMSIVYGYEITHRNDPVVANIQKVIHLAAEGLTPERAALLGTFPFLRNIPAWFPGAAFKRNALVCQKLAPEVFDAPIEHAKKNMVDPSPSTTSAESLVSQILAQAPDQKTLQAMKDCAASSFLESTLSIFVLAMVLHPDVQERAQMEIDTVIGEGRLPDSNDRPSLPYVEALFRELFRWHTAVPLSVPTVAAHEDVFNGYLIPKGAIITTNQWAMAYDEDRYPDPYRFHPERHLTEDGKLATDSGAPAFGFGRRICPGRYIGDASVWIALASMLALFRFEKAVDSEGQKVEIEPVFVTGVARHLLAFPCSIKSRSAEREELVRSCFDGATNKDV
ncbi:hypothetical protein SERLADRAFT_361704 [Serpula lacrymans var. lacrymans S7.9]|uniref:Cytochrome P450 n=1 Tax=Serpula lacrymans var. lacrymans (strain S7.9) TaxID=578457 RepID=F8NY44_SERL9|nr:uncharacterized protein SERLADRAFT_361704 [Serpula lacrymans var. lacrymans S7.9]EGO24806.1 hypothetical protein SERLADRAFT_361704 [Serpula lacrymans var. lacrymans S7.9]